MTHNEKYQKAVDAIKEVFEDMSVPASEVKKDLIRLRDDIEVLLDTLNDAWLKQDDGS